MFVAERIDLCADLIADTTCSLQPFLACASETGRIVKRPVQLSSDACKNGTTLGFGFAADRYYKRKYLA